MHLVSFFCLVLFLHQTVVKTSIKTNTECFNTARHYYSNPKVGGISKLYITYKNDNFRHATLDLNCSVQGNMIYTIKLEGVNLMLPARREEMCLDAHNTSFAGCKFHSMCHCCQQPENLCRKSASHVHDYCTGKQICHLKVKSEFLKDCPGREYKCHHRYCHSRWIEVLYRCVPRHDTTPTPMATVKESETNKELVEYVSGSTACASDISQTNVALWLTAISIPLRVIIS